MKSLARNYIWWSGLDGDLEREARVVSPVRLTETTLLQLQCIHGSGQLNPGLDSMWTMWVHSWARCFCL